jgi:hypothetical protein
MGRGGVCLSTCTYIKLLTYGTEYRIRAKLMNIKLPTKLFCKGLGLYDFDGGKSPTRAIGSDGALKISTLLGPNYTRLTCCHDFRAPKTLIFRAHPFQSPSKWIFLRQNHYVPHLYKQEHFNSQTFKIT